MRDKSTQYKNELNTKCFFSLSLSLSLSLSIYIYIYIYIHTCTFRVWLKIKFNHTIIFLIFPYLLTYLYLKSLFCLYTLVKEEVILSWHLIERIIAIHYQCLYDDGLDFYDEKKWKLKWKKYKWKKLMLIKKHCFF